MCIYHHLEPFIIGVKTSVKHVLLLSLLTTRSRQMAKRFFIPKCTTLVSEKTENLRENEESIYQGIYGYYSHFWQRNVEEERHQFTAK